MSQLDLLDPSNHRPQLEVLRQSNWHPDQCTGPLTGCGITCKLTTIRTPSGRVLHVREALRPPQGWFLVNSGKRMGLKRGDTTVPDTWQALEVVAADGHTTDEDLAFVERVDAWADGLARKAHRNRSMTPAWVQAEYDRQEARGGRPWMLPGVAA